MTSLAGRRTIVTGGANGLGAAVAQRFAELGASGVVLDLPGALAATAPAGWHELPVDVCDERSLAAAIESSVALLGGLDAVVAAAGVVPPWRDIVELDLDEFDRVMDINSRGVVATIKHAAPVLRAGSTISVIGSLNSWQGDPNIIAYVASKHAVLGIVRSAALALGPLGIRVNGVAPGPVATDALLARMAAREPSTGLSVQDAIALAVGATALGRLASAREVADVLAFLSSDLSSAITGQLLHVDCGLR